MDCPSKCNSSGNSFRSRRNQHMLKSSSPVAPSDPLSRLQGKKTSDAVRYLTEVIDAAGTNDFKYLIGGFSNGRAIAAALCGTAFLVIYVLRPSLFTLLPSIIGLYVSAALSFGISFFDLHLSHTEMRRRLEPAKRYLAMITAENELVYQ